MKYYFFIFFIKIVNVNSWSDSKIRKFKDDFLFGVSTSAYQVEGAWDTDGKGESIWDKFLHTRPEVIKDGRNGDVASDSYNNYKRDVQMLKELDVDVYRFSISWPRILPNGFSNVVNEKGVEYYHKLIDELLKYNIKPLITLYHFDLPQTLQDLGGWANPESVQWFVDYARVVLDEYASKVMHWITINQPYSVCVSGYGIGEFAPGIKSPGFGDYLCVKNTLLAHARVYRLYEKEYKQKYKGSVGISINLDWLDAYDNSTENVKATDLYREFSIGLFLNPIWSQNGDFPSVVKNIVAKKSKEEGYVRSRLPELSGPEVDLIKGSSDFLGINHYTTFLVKKAEDENDVPLYLKDLGIELSHRKEWRTSQSPWLRNVPYGLYKLCLYLNEKYNYPRLYITENGWSTPRGLQDQSRVDQIREYLSGLLLAIEDGADVMGYTAWSLMDNVQWTAGTSERFGLYEVDFDSEEKTRTARLSALVYKRIIQKRIVEPNWKPSSLRISITSKTGDNKQEL